MSKQLGFRDLELEQLAAKSDAAGSELEVRLKSVGRACDRKDLAAINSLSYSYLSEVLNGSGEGKRFHIHMIPSLAILMPDLFIQEVISPLCDMAGYDSPLKKKALTPEEELEKITKRIHQHGLESLFADIA